MNNLWSKYPIVKLLIPYVIGVSIAAILVVKNTTFFLCILLILSLLYYFLFLHREWRKQVQSVLLFFIFTCLGVSMVSTSWDFNKLNYVNDLSADYVILKIESEPDYRSGFYHFRGETEQVYLGNDLVEASGTMLLKIEHDHESEVLSKGDFVIINNDLKFALRDSLKRNQFSNIFLKGEFTPAEWAHYKSGDRNWLYNWQQLITSQLESKIDSSEAFGVANALILGNKSKIDYQTYRIFADAGAMHILAVSGLHVGIVAAILSLLLSWIPFISSNKILKVCLTVGALILYAALTGFSPSVCRAVLMFSLFVIGYNFKRDVDIYNIIAASAFLLLIINPLWLFNVGFQLSYMAVLGIVYFFRRIRNLVEFNNPVIQWLWDVTIISITAQIGTLPLTLYYFNQFPVLGIVANPIAMLCALFVVSLGLLFVLLTPFSGISIINFCSETIAGLIEWIILTTSQFFAWIQAIPFSVLRVGSFHFVWLVLMYLMLFVLILFIESRKNKKIVVVG